MLRSTKSITRSVIGLGGPPPDPPEPQYWPDLDGDNILDVNGDPIEVIAT